MIQWRNKYPIGVIMANNIKYPIVNGFKECGDCNKWLPISEYRKARNHLTSRCISCLKIYAANYRKLPEVKEKSILYVREYRKIPANRIRINENTRIYRKKTESKLKRNETRRIWAAKEKQKAIDYKGGQCVCCGYSSCIAALDFHHRDPSEKEGYGTGALFSHRTFERNKIELDKCELVCVRCHREIHAGYRKL